jgi:hypothetical protein
MPVRLTIEQLQLQRALACVRLHMGKRDAWALKAIEHALRQAHAKKATGED